MILGTPIASGNTAEIYLIDGRIIKIFKDHLPPTEAGYEANKQRYAYEAGLFVPEVLDVTRINEKQAIVMEYIKGKAMGELLMENMELAEDYINLSIEVQQRIHSVNMVNLESMEAKLARQIKAANQLHQEKRFYLLQKLSMMKYEKKLCHGDFHLFNLIVTEDNRVSIIDWVDASSGDILADVCRTYLLYQPFYEGLAELYLQLYCQKSGFAKKNILKWIPILAAARLSENISAAEAECLMKCIEYHINLE
ncbi:aminoglycoside phosphotransferase family protein [Alkalihalophilus marmarensis]|uniref:aminoglycoside phosphotransferase family protein n=1 Tax=Alkalihalophilus marmarensis TaxID=521377 RepID=UPI002DBFB801|nr:aminoglycoside phosphotransferase family protein [Alkalihalophilus marmarensis]MEC2072705.1 aminoglycoside phosphotransferase family protein [Alkalihalophilus marmarensis]